MPHKMQLTHIKIPVETVKNIKEIAEKNDRTFAAQVRIFLRDCVDSDKKAKKLEVCN